MLRSSVLSLTILLALTAPLLSTSGPVYNLTSNEAQFVLGPTNQIGTLLFANGFEYYNETNAQIGSLIGLGVNCSSAALITTANQIWCLGSSSSNPNQFSMNQLDTETLQLIGAYSFSVVFNSTVPPVVSLMVSGEYLLVLFENKGDVLSSSAYIFNPISKTFVCSAASVEEKGAYNGAYFTGQYLIYQTQKADSKENEMHYLACNGQPEVMTKVNADTFQAELFSFNNSEVFVTVYYSDIDNKLVNYVLPFSADTTGKFTVGTAYPMTSFSVVDDEHFVGVTDVNGFYVLGLYVVSSNLKVIQLNSWVSPVPSTHGTEVSVVALYGQDAVGVSIFNHGDILDPTTFFFSFNRGIGSPTGLFPPIRFANGTIININSYGFFSQANLGSPIHFTYAPNNNFYQDPTDPTHIMTIYVPSSKAKVLDKCVFVDMWASNSTINVYNFTSCPTHQLSQAPTIKDVAIDASGVPHVCYRDSYANLYIVTPSVASGPFTTTTLYAYPSVSINLTSGTGVFVGVQLTSFVIGQFYLANGTIFSKTSAPGDTYNYVYKLSEQYFLTASANNQATVFAVYNAWTGTKVNQLTTQFVLPFSYSNPISALGVNLSSPSIYTGIIAQVGQEFFLINTQGVSTMIMSQFGPVNDVNPIGPNSFFTTGFGGIINFITTYTVSNWSIQPSEIEVESVKIEY